MNPAKNIVWDSAAALVQAARPILGAAMSERLLILGLLFASLTNAICLYGYLGL